VSDPPHGGARYTVIPIGDLEDPRVAVYRSMRRVAALRKDRRFVAEGVRVVRQLLASELSSPGLSSSREGPLPSAAVGQGGSSL